MGSLDRRRRTTGYSHTRCTCACGVWGEWWGSEEEFGSELSLKFDDRYKKSVVLRLWKIIYDD